MHVTPCLGAAELFAFLSCHCTGMLVPSSSLAGRGMRENIRAPCPEQPPLQWTRGYHLGSRAAILLPPPPPSHTAAAQGV